MGSPAVIGGAAAVILAVGGAVAVAPAPVTAPAVLVMLDAPQVVSPPIFRPPRVRASARRSPAKASTPSRSPAKAPRARRASAPGGRPAPAPRRRPTSTSAAAWAAAPAARAVKRCESRGDPRAVSASGTYRGAWQADADFWRTYGGLRYASQPELATEAQQDDVAHRGWLARGWQPWTCARIVGLR